MALPHMDNYIAVIMASTVHTLFNMSQNSNKIYQQTLKLLAALLEFVVYRMHMPCNCLLLT